jgi:hypothetical protein
MGGRFHGRPCPQHLIVGQLRALQRNCAVHHLSPSPVRAPIPKAIANASTLRLRRQNASSAEGKRPPLQPRASACAPPATLSNRNTATVLILQGSWAVVTPPDPPQQPQRSAQEGTHSAASPFLGRHSRGLDWGRNNEIAPLSWMKTGRGAGAPCGATAFCCGRPMLSPETRVGPRAMSQICHGWLARHRRFWTN